MRHPSIRVSRAFAIPATVLAVAFLLLVLSWNTRLPSPVPNPVAGGPGHWQASAITADFRDLDLLVSKETRTGRIQGVKAALPVGESMPAAPLMDWLNTDVRDGRTMRWCMDDTATAPAVAEAVRSLLTDLAGRFPPVPRDVDGRRVRSGIAWMEGCPGSYTVGLTAEQDCGMAGVVACAVYYGERAGRVSVSRPLLERYGATAWVRVALAHELQHLVLNLGHNACGVVLDPVSGRPVASVMTPIDVGRGVSCSQPPATGLEPADWLYAIDLYRLVYPGGVTVTPTVTPPPPSPSPTPTPTATPLPEVRVYGQRWICAEAGAGCIETVELPPPLAGRQNCYPITVARGDDLSWPFGFACLD